MKRQATDWETIFSNQTSAIALVTRICKELSKLNSKKKKWQIMDKKFPSEKRKKYIWMGKHMKRCLTSFVNREIQIKMKNIPLHNYYHG